MNPERRLILALTISGLMRRHPYWPKWAVSEIPGAYVPDIRPITDEFVGKDLPL